MPLRSKWQNTSNDIKDYSAVATYLNSIYTQASALHSQNFY